MRLLTHNLLVCPVHREALRIEQVRELEVIAAEYRPEFIVRMLPRLDWGVLRAAAAATAAAAEAGRLEALPPQAPDVEAIQAALRDGQVAQYEGLLQTLHHFLVETHVITARLGCPHGEQYAIDGGIPNLLAEAAISPDAMEDVAAPAVAS
ncbi:hypothetical protein CDCA_CDCA08G2514 [Cyanidium caldarium]|uniref:Multifunctional methyltransferase subunit TRM112-like protein n=1 Tax=Cyanidium caldarium TaxID=2771 RepID=A0AAV9IW33_CYACA|nr:hypothetical protein CDCA_CDCA08G2514 [Cyanidium caldarium]